MAQCDEVNGTVVSSLTGGVAEKHIEAFRKFDLRFSTCFSGSGATGGAAPMLEPPGGAVLTHIFRFSDTFVWTDSIPCVLTPLLCSSGMKNDGGSAPFITCFHVPTPRSVTRPRIQLVAALVKLVALNERVTSANHLYLVGMYSPTA